MIITNMYQAKTHLSSLVDQAMAGEEIVIARSGKPIVRLVPYTPSMKPRVPGLFKNQITVPEDIDANNDEIAALFGIDVEEKK